MKDTFRVRNLIIKTVSQNSRRITFISKFKLTNFINNFTDFWTFGVNYLKHIINNPDTVGYDSSQEMSFKIDGFDYLTYK